MKQANIALVGADGRDKSLRTEFQVMLPSDVYDALPLRTKYKIGSLALPTPFLSFDNYPQIAPFFRNATSSGSPRTLEFQIEDGGADSQIMK